MGTPIAKTAACLLVLCVMAFPASAAAKRPVPWPHGVENGTIADGIQGQTRLEDWPVLLADQARALHRDFCVQQDLQVPFQAASGPDCARYQERFLGNFCGPQGQSLRHQAAPSCLAEVESDLAWSLRELAVEVPRPIPARPSVEPELAPQLKPRGGPPDPMVSSSWRSLPAPTVNSAADICAMFAGKAIGSFQGRPVPATCGLINAMMAEGTQTNQETPLGPLAAALRPFWFRPFDEFRLEGYSTQNCLRLGAGSAQPSAVCRWTGLDFFFNLDANNQIEELIVEAPLDRLARSMIDKFMASTGISNATPDLAAILAHCYVLTLRRASPLSETYATDGKLIMVRLSRN